jgi:hypothetical protein
VNSAAGVDLLGTLCSTVDDLGPEAVVLLRDGSTGTSAFVVVDITACGPAIGGRAWLPMSPWMRSRDWRAR